ncbi:DNA-binding protein [Neosynechococcus sphagnicola sy1]|uniref:DNA-binding protein n=1 Tax=Neosynechococcus sphagnicola sy1 TaxID=1497020 RepID=A0A098TPR5_9CYAN|nr:type II toxin-antitoxin system VapC family toxin [Neosynechococcus sphagnicola]KGF72823.1 DNA-binding protein [Neosynechococcus sphagnicola sy1]
MIFVDTGAWFASIVPADTDYQIASTWFNQNTQPLITTDYVIDETLTLLRMRRENQRAIALGDGFFSGTLATIHYLSKTEIQQAWQVFRQFSDKDWSFTDCTSKVVIEKLKLTQAFAFDHHFRQFASITVLP